MKIELNKEVIIVGTGNNARYSTPIYKAIVSKIGRKWFYLDIPEVPHLSRDEKFSLEDGKNDGKGYSSGWQVFESEDVYNEYLNKPKLTNKIEISLKGLTYKQLETVSLFIKSFNVEN